MTIKLFKLSGRGIPENKGQEIDSNIFHLLKVLLSYSPSIWEEFSTDWLCLFDILCSLSCGMCRNSLSFYQWYMGSFKSFLILKQEIYGHNWICYQSSSCTIAILTQLLIKVLWHWIWKRRLILINFNVCFVAKQLTCILQIGRWCSSVDLIKILLSKKHCVKH